SDPTAWDMPLNGLMNRRAYLIESASRNRYVPRLVEHAAAVRTIACVPLHAGPTPVGSLVLVALAPRSFAERDVRMLERPLAELAVMIEAVRRRGARVEPVEAPKTPVAAPPPLPQPAAHVTELQAEREQLRGEVAARSAERAVLAAALAELAGARRAAAANEATAAARAAEWAGEVERLRTRAEETEQAATRARVQLHEQEQAHAGLASELRAATAREQRLREELEAAS